MGMLCYFTQRTSTGLLAVPGVLVVRNPREDPPISSVVGVRFSKLSSRAQEKFTVN